MIRVCQRRTVLLPVQREPDLCDGSEDHLGCQAAHLVACGVVARIREEIRVGRRSHADEGAHVVVTPGERQALHEAPAASSRDAAVRVERPKHDVVMVAEGDAPSSERQVVERDLQLEVLRCERGRRIAHQFTKDGARGSNLASTAEAAHKSRARVVGQLSGEMHTGHDDASAARDGPGQRRGGDHIGRAVIYDAPSARGELLAVERDLHEGGALECRRSRAHVELHELLLERLVEGVCPESKAPAGLRSPVHKKQCLQQHHAVDNDAQTAVLCLVSHVKAGVLSQPVELLRESRDVVV